MKYYAIHVSTLALSNPEGVDTVHQDAIQEKLDALGEDCEIYGMEHAMARLYDGDLGRTKPARYSTVILYRRYDA